MLTDYLNPGHSIPYALTLTEIHEFLRRHSIDLKLRNYLFTSDPPYGIIVFEAYGEFLVWFDLGYLPGDPESFATHLHVLDVTNMDIVEDVMKAPYESPDAGFVANLIERISTLIEEAKMALPEITSIAILVLIFLIVREVRK